MWPDPLPQASVSGEAAAAATAGGAVIVFDGVCVLCNGWVRFLLRHDHRGRYRFAAMQAPAGRALLAAHGLDPQDPVSFLLIDEVQAWTGSEAIVRVLSGLGGCWQLARVALLLPPALRDRLYRTIARNRYRWFGRREACLLPASEHRGRFVE